MATPNPIHFAFPIAPPPVSKKVFTVSGILTSVFGLDELPPRAFEVSCLWLLHPRLQTQACMEPIAASAIGDWNRRLQESSSKAPAKGLLAVSFDQRNHGSREVDKIANESWRGGNERHAQDMFSVYHGSAVDTVNLMDYISAYAFPNSEYKINEHMVLGVSLGGHAAWQCLLLEPRISTAVIIIGCPDYTRLLTDRARLSKLKSWTASEPPGSQFLGSRDFPTGLIEAVEKWDPRGLFCRPLTNAKPSEPLPEPSDKEKVTLRPMIENRLGGKRILNLSGGRDKLVPYAASEPFLNWLKKAVGADGWYHGGGVSLDDIIFDGVGHEMTPAMVREAVKFLGESLSNPGTGLETARGQVRDFKM